MAHLGRDPHPLTYRREIVGPLMRAIAGGESCALIGVGSVGKSNLLRFLMREDVRRHYLGEEWDRYLFLHLDAYALVEFTPWAFYELLLHRLVQTVEALGLDQEATTYFADLYQQVITSERELLAQRYVERAVSTLRGRYGYRLVFLLDEFDSVFVQVDSRLFAGLRALRDDHKYALVYVAASRDDLSRIRPLDGPSEAFYELLSLNSFGLGPYSQADARWMINRLAARRQAHVPADQAGRLIEATGGHPGLLRAATWAVLDGKVNPLADDLRVILLKTAGVREECRKIWEGLKEDEQRALAYVVEDVPFPADLQPALALLERKKVLCKRKPFCRLFADYVAQQGITQELYVDRDLHQVILGRRVITDLTEKEWALLCALDDRRGKVCDRNYLIRRVYPDDDPGAVSDEALQSLVARLRRKLSPSGKRQPIVTVRGSGYKLVSLR